jgi:hypothetical protein
MLRLPRRLDCFRLRLPASPRDFEWSTSLDRRALGPADYVFFEPNRARAESGDWFREVGSCCVPRRRSLAHPEQLADLREPGKFQCHE